MPLDPRFVPQAGPQRLGDILAAAAAQPRSDHRGSASYKRHVVHTFVVRILETVVQSNKEAA